MARRHEWLKRILGDGPLTDDSRFRMTLAVWFLVTGFCLFCLLFVGNPVSITWNVFYLGVELAILGVYRSGKVSPGTLLRVCIAMAVTAGVWCGASTGGMGSAVAMFLINAIQVALINLPLREARYWMIFAALSYFTIPAWQTLFESFAGGVLMAPATNWENTRAVCFISSALGIALATLSYAYRDLYSRKYLEKRAILLEKSNSELRTMQRARDDFYGSVSHELLTPANAIAGITQILDQTLAGDESRRLVAMLDRSTKHLILLINDTTDYRNLVSGDIHINHEPFSPAEMLQDTVQISAILAEERGLAIGLTIEKPLPERLIGDPFRIAQIIHNLLNNGLKYTSEGRVDVVCRWSPAETQGHVLLIVEVRDTGCGISEAAQRRIFDVYYREDNEETRQVGGSGIGLYLCRELASRMGGSINCRSRPGQGSVFTLLLPVELAGVGCPDNDDAITQQALSILVADDSATSRLVVESVLKTTFPAATITSAVDGTDALQRALKHAYDVIVLDLNMPGLNGIEVTEFLRQSKAAMSHHAVIIGFTARAQAQTANRCLAAGMNDVHFKPLRSEVLSSKILKQLRKKEVARRTGS